MKTLDRNWQTSRKEGKQTGRQAGRQEDLRPKI